MSPIPETTVETMVETKVARSGTKVAMSDTKAAQAVDVAVTEGKKVQVLDDFVNSDLTAQRNEYHFRTPLLVTALSRLLRDQRDVPMVCLQLNIIAYLLLSVSLIYYLHITTASSLACNLAGLVHLVGLLIFFMERFILMMHFATHRPIYKIAFMNSLCTWYLAPFFGIPCGCYRIQHVIMHHIENNHDWDASSTEFYHRGSFVNFVAYWFRFAVLLWIDLPYFTLRTKRYNSCKDLAIGISTYVLVVFALARFVSLGATVWVFGVPYIIAFTVMPFGNFAQHIFVDPKNPESNYGLTYNCMDVKGNQLTFNDGYHVLHHLNAMTHWSEMPKVFAEQRERLFQNGALTFRGIHFFDVGLLVMTGRIRRLAEHYVHLGPRESAPTIDALEAKLRSFLAPITPVPHKPYSVKKAA